MLDSILDRARALAAKMAGTDRRFSTSLLMRRLAIDYIEVIRVLGLLRAEGLVSAPPIPPPIVRPRKLPIARLMPAARVLALETLQAGDRLTAELLGRDLNITLARAELVLIELAAERRDRLLPPGRGYDPGGSANSARRLARSSVTTRSGPSWSTGRQARGP